MTTKAVGQITELSKAVTLTEGYHIPDTITSLRAYHPHADGLQDDRDVLNAANAAASTGELHLHSGTYRIASNLTLSANLRFSPGAILSPDSGVTLTMTGTFNFDTLHQIFSGAGTVAGSPRIDYIRPEWWGALPDGAGGTDLKAPLQAAINFANTSKIGIVKFSTGTYSLQTALTFATINDISLVGTSIPGRALLSGTHILAESLTTNVFMLTADNCDRWSIHNITFQDADGTNAKGALDLQNGCGSWIFQHCRFHNFASYGIFGDGSGGNYSFNHDFIECWFSSNGVDGIHFDFQVHDFVFERCWFMSNVDTGAVLTGHNHVFNACVFEASDHGITNDCLNAVTCRGWRIINPHVENMGTNDVFDLARQSYGFFSGGFFSTTSADAINLDTNSDRNIISNWGGSVDIKAAGTPCDDNVILGIVLGTVTDNGTDTRHLYNLHVDEDGAINSVYGHLSLHNPTEEDADGGRESTLIWRGFQSGGEETTLAEIEAAHEGVGDDEQGQLIIRTNDGDDGSSPTDRITISDDATFSGGIIASAISTLNGGLNVSGPLTFTGRLIATPENITITSEGVAASVVTPSTEVTTNGDSDLDNVTLANGANGQMKIIFCVAEGNAADTWKITPANMIGGTQITFSGVGEGCILIYDASFPGWIVIGNNGGTIA